ncbi:MAG TPA: hypothetical protein VMR06_05690 [Dokdonella sp.]|uniref:hypothetical protein n=1 Tax=Dokdonella sp. TaxID=2291710 RepID=UPI002C993656|nr:hypothetical protein [Dokdonella sp.]HUD41476.1 hypothetical protein [Dokdonella sp.]
MLVRYSLSLCVLLGVTIVAAAEKPKLRTQQTVAQGSLAFEPEDPGSPVVELFENQTARQTLRVRNTGTAPIEIRRVDPAPPPGKATFEPRRLAPGEAGRLVLEKPMGETRGLQTVRFHVLSDDPVQPSVPVSFPVFVQSAYSPETAEVNFGYVGQTADATQSVIVESFETDRLSLESILEKPDWLALRAEPVEGHPQQLRLVTGLSAQTPLGEVARRVVLRTNVAVQPELVLSVRAHVHGQITATPPVLSFGAVEQGATVRRTIELRSVDASPLEVAALDHNAEAIDLKSAACGEGCVRLDAQLLTGQRRAVGNEFIGVSFKDRGERVRIPYSALIVKPGTQIRSLGTLDANTDVKIDDTLEKKP